MRQDYCKGHDNFVKNGGKSIFNWSRSYESGQFYDELGQIFLIINRANGYYKPAHLSLLQIGVAITNWGNYYKSVHNK